MNTTTQPAILISLSTNTSEITQLAHTLNYTITHTIIQKRSKPDVNSYIGPGKLTELQNYLENNPANAIIIDGELKPSQWFNLERTLNIPVYDRLRLILAIFNEHAERKEAKLQVELAQLHYERPFVRELIHRTRAGEHPGFMAGGGYQVDDYYEKIKKQMKKIRTELDTIRTDRALQRQNRHQSGFYLVSLTGYTNAGKSQLLNQLSEENVKVEGKLFSTLSTTTRRITQRHNSKKIPILLTDTVGFIQNLPAWIIDAFHSTLEEITLADLIILVIDGSEKPRLIHQKLTTSYQELQEIHATAPILIAFNKIDKLSKQQRTTRLNYLIDNNLATKNTLLPISAKQNINLEALTQKLYTLIPQRTTLHITLPNTEEVHSFISQIHEQAYVQDITYGTTIDMHIEINQKIKDSIIGQAQKLNGTIL